MFLIGRLADFFSVCFVYSYQKGNVGSFRWRPDNNTPDTIFYQSFTEKNMGWKIKVTSSSSTTTLSQILLLLETLAILTTIIIVLL